MFPSTVKVKVSLDRLRRIKFLPQYKQTSGREDVAMNVLKCTRVMGKAL